MRRPLTTYGLSTDSLIKTINPPIQPVNLPGNYKPRPVSGEAGKIDPLGGFLQVLYTMYKVPRVQQIPARYPT